MPAARHEVLTFAIAVPLSVPEALAALSAGTEGTLNDIVAGDIGVVEYSQENEDVKVVSLDPFRLLEHRGTRVPAVIRSVVSTLSPRLRLSATVSADAVHTTAAVLPPISWPGSGFAAETRVFHSGDLGASGSELFDAPPDGATAAEHTVLQLKTVPAGAAAESCIVRCRVICTFTGPALVHAAAGSTVRALAQAVYGRELLAYLEAALPEYAREREGAHWSAPLPQPSMQTGHSPLPREARSAGAARMAAA